MARSDCFKACFIALVLGFGSWAARAQSAAATAPAAAQSTLRGHITDPTGALIPGARITIATTQGGAVSKLTADAAGAYVARSLAAGSYVIQVDFQGFAPFVSKPITLTAGQVKNVDVKMAIEAAQQQVQVTADDSATVNTEAAGNANAIVLKDKDLDALSDDPDELSNELEALAGPSAGPNGGQIYIDGFTGGQLPPKSAIREIRINQNPFSAEFDHIGYGRIEILTKPGTDQLHGRVFALGNDDALNTGSPFTKNIPAYHSIQLNGTISGALSKKASFFLSVENRDLQDASIYIANTAVLSGNSYIPGIVNGALFNPHMRTSVSPRLDLQLGDKNTLTLRYFFWRDHQTGSIGNTALPSQNSTSQSVDNEFQLDDTQVVNDHVASETRFEYRRGSSWQTPVSNAPTVSVPSYFSGGGNSGQSSSGNSDHYELQQFITATAGSHALKFGAWLRDNRQATSTDGGFNGGFSFPTLNDYIGAMNKYYYGNPCLTVCGALNAPNNLSYTTGPYAFAGNVFDGALFVQDDWKYNRFLTLSGGLRWETQNHVADHSDWAPRVAFAYALDGHKDQKQAKTVLRGGFGFFYDRFGIGNLMNLEQNNGTAQAQTTTIIADPTCFDPTSVSKALAQGCSTGKGMSVATQQIQTVVPSYRSPDSEQAGISVDRQLTKTTKMSFTYLRSFGVHQMVVRDANPFQTVASESDFYSVAAGLPRSNPNLGIVDQYFPEAVFKQNQIIVNVNGQLTRNLSLSGFYNWTDANSNGGGGSRPSNSYDLDQDYGRAAFIRPQFLMLMSNYNAPWGLTLNPFMVYRAGAPYSITTANDLTGDNFFNDRPALVNSSYCTANQSIYASTQYGCLDTQPAAGANLLPVSTLTGPSSYAMNLRLSRAFGLGPSTESASSSPSSGGHNGGQGGGGQHGGPGGGFGGGPFGGGGFGRGGSSGTGHKYSLTFSAQALNLFNDVNYGTPSGVVMPTPNSSGVPGPGNRFGLSTSLAGGMFASPTGSASRRIYFQTFFNF